MNDEVLESESHNLSWLDDRVPELYDWYDEYPYDLDMWHHLCEQSRGPILDLACGTGRVAIALARKGHEVVGLDFSPPMIARAKAKLGLEDERVRSRVTFDIGDMSNFSAGRLFPMVIVPCFSFHELTSLEAQESCLQAISRHLDTRGVLILTLGFWTPDSATSPPDEPAELGEPKEEGINPSKGLLTRMWSLGWSDASRQIKYHRLYFEEYADSGRLVNRSAQPEPPLWHARRFLGRYEAEWLLEKHGFVVDRIYGDWDLSDLSAQSKCMIFVATKNREERCDDE